MFIPHTTVTYIAMAYFTVPSFLTSILLETGFTTLKTLRENWKKPELGPVLSARTHSVVITVTIPKS